MKILLIGGSGYIGSELNKFLSQNHKVKTVDLQWFGGDRSDYCINYRELTRKFIKDFDVIVLTAAHSSVPMCNNDPDGAIINNVTNFFDFIKNVSKNQKLIYASSSCVYIKSDISGAKEDDKLQPNDMLSFSKTTVDNYLAVTNPCEWYSLRFGSVNGWSDNFRDDLMINAMASNAIKNNCLSISNGDNYRPILGIKDLVRAVNQIIESSDDKRGIYNIASFNTNIRAVGNSISSIIGCESKEEKGVASYDFCINTEKFRNAYNFEFNETLETIVQSIVDNEETLLSKVFSKRIAK